MRYLKQSTATTITIGPLVDETDGVTPITAPTLGDITAAVIKGIARTSLTLTASDGDNDFVHIADGYFSLELTAGNTDTLNNLRVTLRDDDGFIPVWEDFTVLAANVFDSLIGGGDLLQVDATQISGDATSADNLELDYDGTGFAKANSSIGSVTGAVGSVTGAVGSVGGNVDGNVTGSIGSLGATAKTDVNAEVDTALNTAIPGGATADSINERIVAIDDKLPSGNISDFDETADPVELLDAGGTAGTSADELVDDVWDELIAGHLTVGTTGKALDDAKDAADAAAVADAVWDEDRSGHVGAGSFGEGVLVEDLNTAAKASVNAEVADVIKTDTIPEQSAGAPPATPTMEQMNSYFWAAFRNKLTVSSGTSDVRITNDAGTDLAKAAVSDDGSDFERSEFVAP